MFIQRIRHCALQSIAPQDSTLVLQQEPWVSFVACPEVRRACESLVPFAKLPTPIANTSSLPTSLCLLPSPLFRGEGLGVRGFALCFD